MPGDISRRYKGPKDGRVPSWMEDDHSKCWRCRGDGYFFRVPNGFNPFSAGGFRTAEVSEKIACYTCNGTGRLVP